MEAVGGKTVNRCVRMVSIPSFLRRYRSFNVGIDQRSRGYTDKLTRTTVRLTYILLTYIAPKVNSTDRFIFNCLYYTI